MERFIKRMALIIYIILSFFRYPFPVIMTPFPQIVIQNGHKRIPCGKNGKQDGETE